MTDESLLTTASKYSCIWPSGNMNSGRGHTRALPRSAVRSRPPTDPRTRPRSELPGGLDCAADQGRPVDRCCGPVRKGRPSLSRAGAGRTVAGDGLPQRRRTGLSARRLPAAAPQQRLHAIGPSSPACSACSPPSCARPPTKAHRAKPGGLLSDARDHAPGVGGDALRHEELWSRSVFEARSDWTSCATLSGFFLSDIHLTWG
jgi:hypothetical protein